MVIQSSFPFLLSFAIFNSFFFFIVYFNELSKTHFLTKMIRVLKSLAETFVVALFE